jgi:hypothetical protein
MWKPMGVVTLWLVLIAAPHLGAPATQVSMAGVMPSPAVPVVVEDPVPVDDPGDPYLQAPPARQAPRERREIPGSFATVHFVNALDKVFTLSEVTVTIDGKTLPPVTDLAPGAMTVVFAGRVSPGPHPAQTRLTCRGRQRGPFTYLKDYRWQVESAETLTVPPDRAASFTISAVRHKGMNVPFDRQVDITVRSELVPQKVSVGD